MQKLWQSNGVHYNLFAGRINSVRIIVENNAQIENNEALEDAVLNTAEPEENDDDIDFDDEDGDYEDEEEDEDIELED